VGRGQGRQMQHRINAVHGRLCRLPVLQVTLNMVQFGGKQLGQLEWVTNQDAGLVPLPDELRDQVPADKPRGAGDEYSFHVGPP